MELIDDAELLRVCLVIVGDLGLPGAENDAEANDILPGLLGAEHIPLLGPGIDIGSGTFIRCCDRVGDWGEENDADANDKREGLCGR